MVPVSLVAAMAASSLTFSQTLAFIPPQRTPIARHSRSSWSSLSSGKGFGEKTAPKIKPKPSPTTEPQIEEPTSLDEPTPSQENKGSTLLAAMRTRQAEERNAELQKIAELRRTDEALMEDPGAAAIPERVAQRMGKRMFPFVGLPLIGSMASFVGFWYMATYKDMEFQPAIVASVSFVFLAVGLLVS